jgi:hypothetical protein
MPPKNNSVSQSRIRWVGQAIRLPSPLAAQAWRGESSFGE